MFVEQSNAPPGPNNNPGYSGAMLHSDPSIPSTAVVDSGVLDDRHSSASGGFFSERNNLSGDTSPYEMSPWNQTSSPYSKSPWSAHFPAQPAANPFNDDSAIFAPPTALIGSLVREEGHIYSLATSGDLLYTGSDSKNIRVWKNQKEYSGFKSNSGLVKAIVICADKIFSGHQDGKIRVWRVSNKNATVHKRVGTLPKLMDFLKSSLKPRNYVEVRKKKNALWIKHYDAVSCLSLSQDHGLLYSGSWDKTLKVWRISDSKCLESINAHDDAVNSVVVGFDGLVFTGSADGTVKVWQREMMGAKATKHVAVQTLLKQECAVTALAVNSTVVYCGSSDGLVNFWEREKQLSHGGVLTGHKLAVLCLAAKGSLVLSGSADKTICMWKRSAEGVHSCLSVLSGHTGPVKCLALEADTGSTAADARWVVYSGSLDKSVKVWKVSELAHDIMMQHQNKQSASSASSADDYSAVAHHQHYQQQPSSFSSPCIMGGGGGGNDGVSKY